MTSERFQEIKEDAAAERLTKADISELLMDTARLRRMERLLDTPQTAGFFESVRYEAAHQVKQGCADYDAQKAPTDWFWLIGFLAGKAVSLPEKRKHHIISSAAVLLNWYRQETPGELSPDGSLPTMGSDRTPQQWAEWMGRRKVMAEALPQSVVADAHDLILLLARVVVEWAPNAPEDVAAIAQAILQQAD